MFSGVAVAATGIAVSSGIVMKSDGPGNAGLRRAGRGHARPAARRPERPARHRRRPRPAAPRPASRSDRRTSVDAVKKSRAQPGLRRPGHRDRGPHQPGPPHHRPRDALRLRLRRRPVLLPRLALRRARAAGTSTPTTRRRRPTASRRRCPARRWPRPARTGRTTPPPRSSGGWLHQGQLRHARAAPGASSRATTGTEPIPAPTPASSGSSTPHALVFPA